MLTDGSEFHMRSASWGTWLSGPLGRPCWLTLTPLSQAFPFLPESVIVCLPAHPVCFLEAGDVPANHGSCPGRSQLLALWSAGVQQIDFFLWACVCLRGHALHLASCQRPRLLPAEDYASFTPHGAEGAVAAGWLLTARPSGRRTTGVRGAAAEGACQVTDESPALAAGRALRDCDMLFADLSSAEPGSQGARPRGLRRP